VLLLTVAVAAPVGWFFMLNAGAKVGSGAIGAGVMPNYSGFEAFGRLASWMQGSQGTNWYGLGAVTVGLLTTAFLWMMRSRFEWWPFHPAGYAVSAGSRWPSSRRRCSRAGWRRRSSCGMAG